MRLTGENKDYSVFVLLIIIIVSTFLTIHFGEQKVGYFVDESSSFQQSNADGYRRAYEDPSLFENKWMDNEELNSFFVVQEENTFEYEIVYEESLKNAAHPPLYFLVLHTVFSFFPNIFSKWFAICVNILFNIGTLIILYLFGSRLFRSKWIAVIPCVIWGLAPIAININMLARMYGMVTFFSIGLAFCISELIMYGTSKKRYIGVFVFMYLGVITQYYFLIIATFLCLGYFIFLLFYRLRRHEIVHFIVIIVLVGVVAIISYPSMLDNIFTDYRGKEAVSNLLQNSDFSERLFLYLKLEYDALFWQKLRVVVLVAFSLFIIATIIWIIKTAVKSKMIIFIAGLLFGSGLICTIIAARIAPYLVQRYIVFLLPIMLVGLFIILDSILYDFHRKKLVCLVSIGICAFMIFSSVFALPHRITNLYNNFSEINQYNTEHSDFPTVVIFDRASNKLLPIHQVLLGFSNVYFSSADKLESTLNDLRAIDSNDGILVIIAKDCDQDAILTSIGKTLDKDNIQEFEDYGNNTPSRAYLLR